MARCSLRDRDLSATTQRGERGQSRDLTSQGPIPQDLSKKSREGLDIESTGGKVNSNGIGLRSP